jgi:hypothetical protein
VRSLTARSLTARSLTKRIAAVWPALPALAPVLLLCLPASVPGRLPPADLASVVLVGAACLAAATVARARDSRRPLLSARAAVLLGAPAVACAVATAASADPAAGLTGFARQAQVFALVPLAMVLLLRSHREARLVAGGVVAVALVQGALGAVQYATGGGASYMGQNVRAVGTFGPQHVMGMATVVSYGLVITLAFGLVPRERGAPRWRRPVALGCAGGLVVPLAVSFSRGAWLATAVAALVVLAVAGGWLLGPVRRIFAGPRRLESPTPRQRHIDCGAALSGSPKYALGRRRLVLAVCAAGLLLAGGALGAGAIGLGEGTGPGSGSGSGSGGYGLVAERLGSIGRAGGTPDQSVTDRYAMWSAAAGMWREEPLTGVGPGGFAAHRDSHASLALSSGSDTGGAGAAFERQELLSPHNMYLLLLGEQGLIGATAVVGSLAAVLTLCLTRLRRAAATERGMGLAATGLLVWQAVNFLYADIGGPTTVLTAVALGLAAWWALSPAATRS